MKISCPRALFGNAVIVLIPLVAAVLVISFIVVSSYQSKRYFDQTEIILADLEKEVETLDKSFKNFGTIVSTDDQGQKNSDTLLEIIKPPKQKIDNLKSDYDELSVSRKWKSLDEEMSQSLELAIAFTIKYERTAKLITNVYDAYGQDLRDQLNTLTKNLQIGGNISIFITQTEKTRLLADDATKRMEKLNPSDDDKEYYNLILEHLNNLETSMDSMHYYYSNGQITQARQEVEALTVLTNKFNSEVKESVKNYKGESSVAQDLKKLKATLEEIDDAYF